MQKCQIFQNNKVSNDEIQKKAQNFVKSLHEKSLNFHESFKEMTFNQDLIFGSLKTQLEKLRRLRGEEVQKTNSLKAKLQQSQNNLGKFEEF